MSGTTRADRGGRARRVAGGGMIVALMAGSAGMLSAQKNPYLKYTEEKFVDNMQAAGRNYEAVTSFIAKHDYESAKAQLTRAREQLGITITFWRDAKRDEAVAILRKALTGMDDLDVALGAEPVDASTIAATSQRINAACQSCHDTYREQDAATKKYRVRRSP
jgi:cytochrome c556